MALIFQAAARAKKPARPPASPAEESAVQRLESELHAARGELQEAANQYQYVVTLKRDCAEAHNGLGVVLGSVDSYAKRHEDMPCTTRCIARTCSGPPGNAA